MYTRSPHYLYQRNGIYYFTRQVPSDLKTKFNKNRVVISLRTSSKQKAIESANKLTDRLETYWNTLRLELFHTKELKLSFLDNQKSKTETVKLSKALDTYMKLKGNGFKTSCFVILGSFIFCPYIIRQWNHKKHQVVFL